MHPTVRAAIITGICGVVAGAVGALGAVSIHQQHQTVNVNVNGETVSVSQQEYQEMYAELKKQYDALISKPETTAASKNVKNQTTAPKDTAYIGEQVKAYFHEYYYTEYSYLKTKTFSMGGKDYKNGFTISNGKDYGKAYYNLDSTYTTLSGLVGNVDGFDCAASFCIYGDDVLLSTLEVPGTALPQEFCVDVTGVRQLRIEAANDTLSPNEPIGFADVALR